MAGLKTQKKSWRCVITFLVMIIFLWTSSYSYGQVIANQVMGPHPFPEIGKVSYPGLMGGGAPVSRSDAGMVCVRVDPKQMHCWFQGAFPVGPAVPVLTPDQTPAARDARIVHGLLTALFSAPEFLDMMLSMSSALVAQTDPAAEKLALASASSSPLPSAAELQNLFPALLAVSKLAPPGVPFTGFRPTRTTRTDFDFRIGQPSSDDDVDVVESLLSCVQALSDASGDVGRVAAYITMRALNSAVWKYFVSSVLFANSFNPGQEYMKAFHLESKKMALWFAFGAGVKALDSGWGKAGAILWPFVFSIQDTAFSAPAVWMLSTLGRDNFHLPSLGYYALSSGAGWFGYQMPGVSFEDPRKSDTPLTVLHQSMFWEKIGGKPYIDQVPSFIGDTLSSFEDMLTDPRFMAAVLVSFYLRNIYLALAQVVSIGGTL